MNLNPLFFNKISGEPDKLFIGQQKNGTEPHLFSDIIKVTEEELKEDNLKNVNLQFDKILANLNEIDIDTPVDAAVIEKLKFLFNNPDLKNFKIDDDLYNLENAKISNSSIIFDRQSLELVLKKIKSIYKDQAEHLNKGGTGEPEVDSEKDFVFESTLNTDVVLNALINHESIKFTFKSDANKITFLISELKQLDKEFSIDLTNLNIEPNGNGEVSSGDEDSTTQTILNTASSENTQPVGVIENNIAQSKQIEQLPGNESTTADDTKIFQLEVIYSESSEKQKQSIPVNSPFHLDENTSEQIEKFLSNYSSSRNIASNADNSSNDVDDNQLTTHGEIPKSSGEQSPINENKKVGKIFYINSGAETKTNLLPGSSIELGSENVKEITGSGKNTLTNVDESVITGKSQNTQTDARIAFGENFHETKIKDELIPGLDSKSKVSEDTLHGQNLEEPILNKPGRYQEIPDLEKTKSIINKTDSESKPTIKETPKVGDITTQQIAAQTTLKEFIVKDKINSDTKLESSSTSRGKVKKEKKINFEDAIRSSGNEGAGTKVKVINQDVIGKESEINVDDNSSKLIDKTKAAAKESEIHEEESGDHSLSSNEIQGAESKIKVSSLKESPKTLNNENLFNNELKSLSAKAVKAKIIGDASSFNDNIKVINANEVMTEITKYLQTNEKQSITFQLSPENLGKIKLMVDMVDSQLHANIEVENEQIRQIVQTNLDQLKSNLQSSGIQSANVNVSLGNYEQRSTKNPAAKKKNFVNGNGLQIEKEITSPKKKLGYNTYEFLA
ncbi:MAG: flagellar hook-length control protein FliK [Bacteroidota bacterium]